MINLFVRWVNVTQGINVKTLSQQELEDLFEEAGTFGEAQQFLDNAVEQELERRKRGRVRFKQYVSQGAVLFNDVVTYFIRRDRSLAASDLDGPFLTTMSPGATKLK
ncbi:hypothetical protein KFU94_24190 [Chloroflexi bacterium TSY]|nr:hypothetical protein [Chloroflexi bacterium TSY]